MFIDASAIVAILGREPGYEEIEKRLGMAKGPFLVSPLVRFEAAIGLARQKALPNLKPSAQLVRQAQTAVDAFIEDLGAEEMTITSDIGTSAVAASATYGKAVGHVADLNFGDCFAYACAKIRKVGLVYKGHDFAHTDLAE